MNNLNEIAAEIHAGNVANGFYHDADKGYFTSHQLLEVIKEVAEASEAHKKGELADLADYETAKAGYKSAGFSEGYAETEAYKLCIKDKFETEIVDSLFRLLDLSAFLKIDLDTLFEIVKRENSKRGRLHGKKY